MGRKIKKLSSTECTVNTEKNIINFLISEDLALLPKMSGILTEFSLVQPILETKSENNATQ